jgi:plasmid stabilization system protein ParE
VDAVIERIESNPLQFPVIEAAMRRCIVHRFPYSVLFRVLDSDCVRILLVRHHRRDPRFGLNRS